MDRVLEEELIYLPVSVGEALDKLSILDIKIEKISDKRINDVKKERDILMEKLYDVVQKYFFLYNELKKVNLEIWDCMEFLRDGNLNDNDYFVTNKKTILKNDVRFRIKNKINILSNSVFKEQKSYVVTKKIIDLKYTNVIFEKNIQYITECSLNYDEVVIFCNENNYNIIKNYFSYDKTITIFLHKF